MRKIVLVLSIISVAACHNTYVPSQDLQSQVDSLQNQLKNTYKPGLGEFMSMIQVHHEKLWFAGNAHNWQLADFEIHEIMEAVDNIKIYAADRPETKFVVMLQPAIDSLDKSIDDKNITAFKKNFILLTNTCNTCHTAVNYSFNKIKIPDTPPFSNQVFKIDSVK